jgi:hypothetical protein
MLHKITNIEDPLINFILDDPVRPEIPITWRVEKNREIFTLVDDQQKPQAIVCVAYCDSIPRTVDELFQDCAEPQNAIFYTIWSYSAGAGRQLIFQVQSYLKETCEHITRYVTLSPPTEMAKKFHLKNGAIIFRDNTETVNYEYK